MSGLNIEIERVIDINKVVENALIIIICYLFIVLVVKLFYRYKNKMSIESKKVKYLYRNYQNPIKTFRLIFVIGVFGDILVLWTLAVYPFPYITILITLSILFSKIKKILKISRLAGIDVDSFQDAGKIIVNEIIPKGKEIIDQLNKKEENDETEN